MRRLTISIEQECFDAIEKERKKQNISASKYINFLIRIAFKHKDNSSAHSHELPKNEHNIIEQNPLLETLISAAMETKYHVRRLIHDSLDHIPETRDTWLEEAKKRANICANNLTTQR